MGGYVRNAASMCQPTAALCQGHRFYQVNVCFDDGFSDGTAPVCGGSDQPVRQLTIDKLYWEYYQQPSPS